jgi:hypothetical protein
MFSVKMSKSNGEIIDNMDPNCRRDMDDRYGVENQDQSPDQYLAEDYVLSTEKRPRGSESRSASKSRASGKSKGEPSTLRKKKVTIKQKY